MSRSSFESLDEAYQWVIAVILRHGTYVAPRSLATVEARAVSFSIADPRRRYVSLSPRRWSFPYAVGELCWHLRGSTSVTDIAFYSPCWTEMSEDGTNVRGSSYGAKIFGNDHKSSNQWSVVKQELTRDPESRRAVLAFAEPLGSDLPNRRDVSCATSLQLMVRDRKLEAIAVMRSNDAILGLPYDVFLFTMLQEMMACELNLDVGTYSQFVGSVHVYESDLATARDLAQATSMLTEPMPHMDSTAGLATLLEGELASRDGSTSTVAPHQRDYWSNLLSVIQYRNALRRGVALDIRDTIATPLYRRLVSLRVPGDSSLQSAVERDPTHGN